MKNPPCFSGPWAVIRSLFSATLLGALALLSGSSPASAQWLTLANPHWNITLTDAGYSDFLLDNTPGFEGREYLSGEWGAAVGYQVNGGSWVTPQWLERQFSYPDWVTTSSFTVKTPITQIGLNADNLPIAQSVIQNNDLEITLRHEMIDTVVGTPMGATAASAGPPALSIASSRYVLKQTITIKAKPGTSGVSNLQLFQFLHGLQSQRGVYDNRLYSGPNSDYRYDVTLAGVDAWAVGAGSSDAGLEDYIGFHANVAPTALEIGHYGIEGNGADDHWSGKPTTGVHWSVEDNWQTLPYSTRNGTDSFAPTQRWVAGAQRWNMGGLAAGQSVSLDVLLSVRTGTRVPVTDPGTPGIGGCNGGSGVPGGLDYEFENVTSEGSCFGEYSRADDSEIAVRVAQGEFEPLDFPTPGQPAQIWKVAFSGSYEGNVNLTLGYDPTILPPNFDQGALCLYEFVGSNWQKLPGTANPASHTIAVSTPTLGPLALGVDSAVNPTSYSVTAAVSPLASGAVTGAGAYMEGTSITLAATAAPGFVFAGWTEGGLTVSTSPNYTLQVLADHTFVAHFVDAGSAKSITTSSNPSNGGTTSGDGAFPPGGSATVVATPSPGYKFSKWQVGGVTVSTLASYTFTVADDRALVAKFKPVYTVTVTPDPLTAPDGEDFEVEGDGLYEPGELAKMKAKTRPGYSFVNWTQNGAEISTDPNFQFSVTGNRDLVGHFAPGLRVDASAIPPHAGTITGTGVSTGPFTLEAIPQPGYVFLNWAYADEPDVPVSEDSPYLFTPDASLSFIANFGLAPATGNEAPTGSQDSLDRLDNTRVAKVLKSALLQNDSDADADPLTLVAVGDATPAGATVTLAGGFVVYTAPAEDAGDGSFTYLLSDGPGGHLVTVIVTVTQTPSNPVETGANAASIVAEADGFVITFIGVPGHSYRVQHTETLSPPAWTDFAPAAHYTAPANGVFNHTDTPPGGQSRFYRAIANP